MEDYEMGMTIAHRHEPKTLPVDRKWLADMLADLEAGNIEECKDILRFALRLFDREEIDCADCVKL